MKLIKKMLAIMFAFMMVVGMGTIVNAEEGAQPDTKGTITVSNVKEGHTYKLYKILNLESYTYETGKANEGNYSYTLVGNEWDTFVRNNAGGNKFFTITDNKYVTSNQGASAEDLAKAAIEFAKEKNLEIQKTPTTDRNENLVFSDLDLGYYLVDSSVGAFCGLDTTNSEVTIQEKNDVPTVEKKVSNIANGNFSDSNFANIGDTVHFQTSITAQPGAQNYVLHDTMSAGLTLNKDIIVKFEDNSSEISSENYVISYDVKHNDSENNQTTCTFDITFTEDFCNTLTANKKIIVTYSATLNDKALIHQENVNKTQLSYGDNNKTNEGKTSTVTYEIKVLKYSGASKKPLKGATFKLYDSEVNGKDETVCKSAPIQLVKNGNDGQNYRRALKTENDSFENNSFAEVTTTESGAFSIQGIKPGIYYLEETAAPKGYNKLSNKIEVVINGDGTLIVDGKSSDDNNLPISQVNVENKTGTLLPSTGGMGTTIIYMAGAVLVIASGIVLVSKKRSKAK